MQKRKLVKSNLEVSAIGLGSLARPGARLLASRWDYPGQAKGGEVQPIGLWLRLGGWCPPIGGETRAPVRRPPRASTPESADRDAVVLLFSRADGRDASSGAPATTMFGWHTSAQDRLDTQSQHRATTGAALPSRTVGMTRTIVDC